LITNIINEIDKVVKYVNLSNIGLQYMKKNSLV